MSGKAAPKGTKGTAKPKTPTQPKAKAQPLPQIQTSPQGGNWKWWLLIPIVTILPYLLSKAHYQLPAPIPPYDAAGRPQASEERVLAHIEALENIGYRIVGTEEALAGERYVLQQVQELEEKCKAGGVLRCEVWEQKGSGFHEFEILSLEVLKVYKGITNIVLRISALDPPSGPRDPDANDAILLGSHIDSTLPSPGAADDGMGVGVMLDIARVLVERNEPFDNSIIFLWNGGEETLQDGSHLYSTQHETRQSVKAVINLEAAGSTGGALLFQATSAEMIEAYMAAPHPRGTVVAADVFASGIILSDTDFIQFQQYLNVSGLDMAIVGHSYFYHTRDDTLENIERGSAQHFCDNAMGVVDFLLSPASPLSKSDWSEPDVVYLSLYDRVFVHWKMSSADTAYTVIAAIVTLLTIANINWQSFTPFLIALVGTPIGFAVGLLWANFLAQWLDSRRWGLLWFRHEHLSLLVYCPIAYAGNFATQYVLSSFLDAPDLPLLEHSYYYAQITFSAMMMLGLQALRIRSAYIFAVLTSFMMIGAMGNEAMSLLKGVRYKVGRVSGYILPLAGLMVLGVEAVTNTLDIFAPLTGRMGKEAPAESIVASISAAMGFIFFPPLVPLFHRLPQLRQRQLCISLLIFTGAVVGLLVSPLWTAYDDMHPRRAALQYTYNHTDSSHRLHVGYMDRGSVHLHEALHERLSPASKLQHTWLTQYDPDWDVVYPVSSFLDTWRFNLDKPINDRGDWPQLQAEAKTVDRTETERTIQLRIDFAGMILPTFAFEAEIKSWNFDFPPPKGKKRHHFKIAASHDDTVVDLEMSIPLELVHIDWSAIDIRQMYPNTAPRLGPDLPASQLLAEVDAWANDKYKGSFDMLMYGAVTGVLEI